MSEDTISRQAAIDALDVGKELLSCALDNMDIVGNDREKFEWGLGLIESYIDDIKDIPSALTVRMKGKWINVNEGKWNTFEVLKCSVCGEMDNRMSRADNYCPNCGADMRGESE